jgi:hypothetical protein
MRPPHNGVFGGVKIKASRAAGRQRRLLEKNDYDKGASWKKNGSFVVVTQGGPPLVGVSVAREDDNSGLPEQLPRCLCVLDPLV